MDPDAITRVDITTDMIKTMSDAELEDLLRKMRGNREVAQAKSAARGERRAASPKQKAPDSGEDFI